MSSFIVGRTVALCFVMMTFVASCVDAQCSWEFLESATHIKCHLRILESQGLDLHIAGSADKLDIQCSDSLLYASELPTNAFIKLQKLNIEKIQLNTQNSVWGPAKSLEIFQDSFNSLKNLQYLDLSANNIRQLPEGIWCKSTQNLQVLNLTMNRLRTFDTIGFSVDDKVCSGSELQILDVSFNELRTVPENWGASRLLRLQQLNLQHNNITQISADAFTGLSSLRILNLSNNHLESLPNDIFANNKDLREVHLKNNELYDLPRGIFHHLEQLLILDLSGNQLTSHHVDNNTFSGLMRLIVLNLASNALTRIGAKTFKELYFLQILNLRNNSIGHIEEGTFLPLYNLHTLNLAENRLHTLDNKMFNGLFVLSKLTLSNNLINIIEDQAFQCTFKNLNQLTGLRLIDNRIGNLTKGMFAGMPRLSVLNLAKNNIQSIEIGTFDENIEIEAIRLDKNFLTNINGLFATLASLLWLNLSENHLTWFDYAFVPRNLKWLDIHGNYIEKLENYYKLQEEIHITTLDASHNRITEINKMAVPNSIELLFINNNMVTSIASNTFVDKMNLTRVDLYANMLSKVQLNSLRVAPSTTPEFYLGGNPFECDCSMNWLLTINNQSSSSRMYPKIMDLGNIECLMPHSRSEPIRLLTTLSTSDFVCKYDRFCPDTCHCCDFDNCNCEMVCPQNCSCFHDANWTTNIVDCGKQNLNTLPKKIPTGVTDLYLDALYLNGSNIVNIEHSTFTTMHTLEVLHLENNKLQTLEGYEFAHLSLLKELYLHNNLLNNIGNSTFAPLVSLQILRIDNNRLTSIPMWQFVTLQYRNSLQAISMGRNSWTCRCKFLQELTQFAYENTMIIQDPQDIYCVDGAIKRELDLNSSSSECVESLESTSSTGANQDQSNGYISLLAAVLVLIFLVVILIIGFVFRESLRMWLFAHYGVRVCESRFEDAGKLYDAIILHSARDYEFVCRNIATELEHGGPPFRLCIQQRDLPPEASHLQIVEASRASRKIILILTKNLLATEWTRPEFRSAFHEALRGCTNKLVIVEETEVSIPSNRISTCDRYFWDKLRFAIPIELSPRGNNYTLDHHERFKQPVSPGVIFRQAPPPPAYYPEDIEANYSSATTATPSPRPTRHMQPSSTLRPPSEHIYSSIESEYSAYDLDPNGQHNLHHQQQQQLLPSSYRQQLQQQHHLHNNRSSKINSMGLELNAHPSNWRNGPVVAPVHIRSGSGLSSGSGVNVNMNVSNAVAANPSSSSTSSSTNTTTTTTPQVGGSNNGQTFLV
uniref:TIR domain-containing protein n=1 Tax=Megaselia scalaris TaxID=36166 RepID=T1GQR7_MEGSC